MSKIRNFTPITGFSLLDCGLRKSRDLEEAYRKGMLARSIQERRSLRLVDDHAGVGIEGGTLPDAYGDFMQSRFRFHDAIPCERRRGDGESGDAARQFTVIRSGIQDRHRIGVESCARADVKSDGSERDDG